MAENSHGPGMTWLIFALLKVVSWGAYGLFLHTGQTAMGGGELARYRAFRFVGLANFLTAIHPQPRHP